MLDDLAKLLELGIVSEEVQVAESLLTSCGGGRRNGCGGIGCAAGSRGAATLSMLRCQIEEIDVAIIVKACWGGTGRGGGGRLFGGLALCRGGLLLLKILGDALGSGGLVSWSTKQGSEGNEQRAGKRLTVNRYSTARSGL